MTLVRVTFDAVKGSETKNGVCYYTSNDKAAKETIIRKSQIVQEVKIGKSGNIDLVRRELNRLESLSRTLAKEGQWGQVEKCRLRIEQHDDYLVQLETQQQIIDNEWYEYCIMQTNRAGVHRGPMSKESAVEWIRSWREDCGPNANQDIFYITRRPVGKWERYNV